MLESGLTFPSLGVFPTQGSNPRLLFDRQILYHRVKENTCFNNYSASIAVCQALYPGLERQERISKIPVLRVHGLGGERLETNYDVISAALKL